MVMKSIVKTSVGQKPKRNNSVLVEKFQKLRTSDFELEDRCNLCSVIV